jgi:hypothetical protein
VGAMLRAVERLEGSGALAEAMAAQDAVTACRLVQEAIYGGGAGAR